MTSKSAENLSSRGTSQVLCSRRGGANNRRRHPGTECWTWKNVSPKVGALVPCFSALVEWWFYAKGKQQGKLLENNKCPTTEIRKTRGNQNDDTKSWQVPTTHRCSLALVSRFVPRIDFQAPRCNRRSRSTKDLKLLQHLPATVED